MGDPVTQGLFLESMQQLRADFEKRHRDQRQDMTDGFNKLADKFDAHAREDAAVERRVLVIETERKDEESVAAKRGMWAGIIAGAGVTSLFEIIKSSFMGKP